jgi:hypothetical protein
MTELTAQAPSDLKPVLWKIAGAFALAHVILLFAGFSQERSPSHGASLDTIRRTFVEANLPRVMAGGYVESLSFVVLLPALVFTARAIGRRTEIGRWAANTSLAAGTGYVVSTLAVGMPAGAAALYGAQHGADLHTVMVVDDIRNYAFYLSIALAGAQALALGVAAISDRIFTRWVGYVGVAVGVLAIGGAALVPNVASMAWVVWWVGVAVALLRPNRQVRIARS